MIQLHDKHFVPFITAEEIDFALADMARQIGDDFAGETPVFIGILNGAFMVLSGLLQHYTGNCEVSFLKLESYEGTATTGQVKQLIGLSQSLEGRSVVVVEDMVDTGTTIQLLKELFKEQHVKLFKIATLFLKPDTFDKSIRIDYTGIRIPNRFIVGFGLDYNGLGRNLPDVYELVAD